MTFFKDATNSLRNGPFGVTWSAFSKSTKNTFFSVGWNGTIYHPEPFKKVKFYGKHNALFGGMYEVATAFMIAESAMVAISGFVENPVGLVTSMASLSWPMTIYVTKEIWNKRMTHPIEYPYSLEYRQNTGKRPKEFCSSDNPPRLL